MKQYVVAPYVTVGIQNKKLFIGFGSIQFEESDTKRIDQYLNLIHFFKTPRTLASVHEAFSDAPQTEILLRRLLEKNFLVDIELHDKKDRFSRQKLFFQMSDMSPVEAQLSLANKKVAIIGCGGIGNQVSVHLATAGVGEFVLCDADTIELSNLSRQILFREENEGQYKVNVLAQELKSRISDVQIATIREHILNETQLEFAKSCDFVVVSADSGNVVNIVNRYCVENKVPYMNVGYVNDISVWGPLYVPGETGCYACQDIIAGTGDNLQTRALIREINSGYQAPSVGPINMISSGLASLDILKYLAGHPEKAQSLNKRIGLWTHDLKFEYQNCSRNPKCSVCGDVL